MFRHEVRSTGLMAVLGCAAGVVACVSTGVSGFQTGPAPKPASVADVVKVINLETFPTMDGATNVALRRVASLSYVVKSDVKKAHEFQKQKLLAMQWKEQAGGSESDQGASSTFVKNGFVVAVSVFPAGAPDKAEQVNVFLINLGNVDVRKLPVPPGAKPLYTTPASAGFVAEKSVEETTTACQKLLLAQGWQPYGSAGDSRFYKQNAVRLRANVASAPAQEGKAVITYSTEQLSADLPAPPETLQAQYSDATKQLLFDTQSEPDAIVAFYRESLGKSGWTPTTDSTIKSRNKEVLFFNNPEHDVLNLEMYKVAGKLRVTLKHFTAVELAELDRLAKAEEARRKQSAPPRPTVDVALPAEAKEIEQTRNRIEFKLDAGKAKAAVESLRTKLREAGWKEQRVSLQPMAGTLSFTKGPGNLTIIYVDTGLMLAEVTISAIGVTFERASEKPK
jgi:hypothetical protein